MANRPLIYITGPPGSGKTTVCAELKRRGYEVLDTDNDGIAFFYNNETSEPIVAHVPAKERTPDWRKRYTWKAKRETIEKLLERDGDGPLFLCGVTANDADDFWDVFTKVFALVIEDETELRRRIMERKESDFGKNPHEMAMLLEWQKTAAEEYKKLGAEIVDSSMTVNEVVETILGKVSRVV